MLKEYLNKTISFNTRAPGVLGARIENVTVTAILDYQIAAMLTDINAQHARVKSAIPDLPEQAGAYNYARLVFRNGSDYIIGIPWIDANSIEVIGERSLFITIPRITDAMERVVRQALLQNGVDNFDISYSTSQVDSQT